jgi:outer membrane protein assembly complex protein YaeT
MRFHDPAGALRRVFRECVLKAKPAGQGGHRCGCGILLGCALLSAATGWTQHASPAPGLTAAPGADPADAGALALWEGLPVRGISFEGIDSTRLAPLPGHLAQALGTPLNRASLQHSLRQLYATGLFETIQVSALPLQDGVALTFIGVPRTFIGTVTVDGAKGATVNTQLQRASQLVPGVRFTQAKLTRALEQMRLTLTQNGFHAPTITQTLTPHPDEQIVDIAFTVASGPQARVGSVEVAGDSGMSAEAFRRHAHLKTGARVEHDTANRALAGVLKQYRREDRLEAEIKLESEPYAAANQRANFRFSANRGPQVKVLLQGASTGEQRLKRVIPVFEEGTVDDDLLNEGNRRLRDYYQFLGYIDVKVDHEQHSPSADQVVIVYKVRLGPRRRVQRVSVAGNHYFSSATLKELLSVHAADALDRHGAYSQTLVAADVNALQAVYHNNGFQDVRITPETSQPYEQATDGKTAPLAVVYRIEEGAQTRVGSVKLEGTEHTDPARLMPLLNTAPGQLLSPQNLAGDRDALLTDYLSRGFDHVTVDVTQQVESADATKADVVFHITEGQQIFVRKVLLTGLHYTRPTTIDRAITIHPDDPLNPSALAETQRNLYDFALFNEIDTAIENPTGDETNKTVLIEAAEARRWALTYGFGFEAQTGTPQTNCASSLASGVSCTPSGKTSVSPRVLLDLTRNNISGREQSASLRGTYGLLEQKISLLFQVPHFEGNRNFGLTLSGGYANSQDVTTYVASKLEGGVRWTEHFTTPLLGISKANTLIYEFSFRRVKVAADSLQVFAAEVPVLSAAVRVAGPGLTWIRDTRDSPLDAHRGTYTSFQDFLSLEDVGAQAQFNRLDLSNSNYWSFDKGRVILARNTRYAQERAFGSPGNELLPLPERLFAGGAMSLRGYTINAAGPRDPQTGFPIGGAGALVNSTELRLPAPMLPWLGNTVSPVLFHDMGNVFANASDAFPSALRIRQPNRDTCRVLTGTNLNGPLSSIGQLGNCSYNYFSHATGLGVRYHTPVGPIRLDFSYNLNPPIYPVISTTPAYVGEARHFNFFFSLGQIF